ncbi:tetratricopeptide repeat protein [Pantanalinema sp. GBBB05]|uniref:tetratricopeptide repeat protein n=1 Tax=Pantanalinema sp. GBBB05 TaxID=2604139 RepID=UPI001D21F7B2|nr:tetratricopeptide repeat protein [Pantanalinema sp. GBBB05]
MLESPLTQIVACFLIGILLVFGIAAIGSLTLIMKLVLLLAIIAGMGIWYISLGHQPESQTPPSPVSTVALTRYDAPAFIRRGWVAWERGDDQAAIAAFEQAIQLNPDLAGAYIGRGRGYFQLGEQSVALADCQQAMQLPLTQPIAFYQRGNLRYDLGDPTGAKADFTHAIVLEADSPESVGLATATDYYMRGVARYRLEDWAGAIADLEMAAQLSEATPEPRVHQHTMDLIREIQP